MDFKKKKRYRENTPISNNNNKNAMELYGFYYDKEKNRYFPINQDLQSNFFKKENKKETKPIKSNWIKTIYSTYSLISRYSKIISNKALYSSFPMTSLMPIFWFCLAGCLLQPAIKTANAKNTKNTLRLRIILLFLLDNILLCHQVF